MAKVIDVTDVDDIPGAGMLHFDDGRPPLMALPEIADDYRTHLGIPDNRVAGPGGCLMCCFSRSSCLRLNGRCARTGNGGAFLSRAQLMSAFWPLKERPSVEWPGDL